MKNTTMRHVNLDILISGDVLDLEHQNATSLTIGTPVDDGTMIVVTYL